MTEASERRWHQWRPWRRRGLASRRVAGSHSHAPPIEPENRPEDTTTLSLSTPDYQDRVDLFDQLPARTGGLVLLGDGLLAELGYDLMMQAAEGVLGVWTDLIRAERFANRAIRGDTTLGVLERLHQAIALAPRVLILGVGVNDLSLGHSIGAIAATCARIVGILRRETPDTAVVVLGVLPSSAIRPAQRIPDLNGQFRAIAGLHDAAYLDFYPFFLGETGAGLRPDDSDDSDDSDDGTRPARAAPTRGAPGALRRQVLALDRCKAILAGPVRECRDAKLLYPPGRSDPL